MKKKMLFALTATLSIGLYGCGGQSFENEPSLIPNQGAAVENHSREEAGSASIVSEEHDYSGFYADTQGTSNVYSELELVYQGNGSYKAAIGLYRLTTFQGTAVVEGENLLFENESDMRVKGKIFCLKMKVICVSRGKSPYGMGEQFLPSQNLILYIRLQGMFFSFQSKLRT